MKKILFIIAILFIVQVVSAQTDSLYLGQTPPGTTPILFADDLMLGGTALQCGRIAISTDGKEIYFTKRNSIDVDIENIQYFKYADNTWNGPFILFPDFPTMNLAPTFSPDGDTLYFLSIENNIALTYFTKRDADGWTTPQLFKGYSDELYYLQETDNYNFYVGVQQAIDLVGNWDICKITFNNDTISAIQSLGVPINTTKSDVEFFIAKNESFIVLGRNESSSNRDLYISYKKDDNSWSNPKSLGPKINTGSVFKWGPFVTPDNKYLFYESTAIRWTTWWVRFDGMLDSLKHTNYSPYLKAKIPEQTDSLGHFFSYIVPDSTFFDDDGNTTLTYTSSLSNGNPLPLWLSFDSIARSFSGTPDEAYTLNIKVTATDTANASASCTFKITVLSNTAVNQLEDAKIKIFPNPAEDEFTINFGNTLYQETRIEITDISGKSFFLKTVHNSSAETIDISGFSKGVYLVNIRVEGRIVYNNKICLE